MTMPRPHRGFTLLELMAVVCLLGIAASVLAVGWSDTGDSHRVNTALRTLLAADARARTIALEAGGSRIIVDPEAGLVVIDGVGPARSGATLSLPIATACGFVAEGSSGADTIDYDSAGRSVDFVFWASRGVSSGRVQVAGLTGSVINDEGAP